MTNKTNNTNNNTLTASEYFALKRQGIIAPGTNPAIRPKTVSNMTAKEYFEKKRAEETKNNNVSRETLLASKANKETAKASKKELNTIQRRKELETFRKMITTLTKKKTRDFVEYENVTGLFRLYIVINNKRKCIARVKLQKDVYVLVREEVAKALDWNYELINYNLPAGAHFQHNEIKDVITALYNVVEK